MRHVEKPVLALIGLMLGSLLAGGAGLFLTDLPDKSELITVSAYDIVDVRYSEYRRKGARVPRMCFVTRQWDCVIFNEGNTGFKELGDAVDKGRPFSIGFIQARELFSDSPQRYNMVYAVEVDGHIIESFEGHLMAIRIMMGIVLAAGLTAIGFSLRALRRWWRP